jgi:cyanophycinase-like exopeptidase
MMVYSDMRLKALIIAALAVWCVDNAAAQTGSGYRSFLTGDPADVRTQPQTGVVLAGGGADNDDAMRWMLRRASGGDVVVLRADGSDGYNEYFYRELGVAVNSVETIVFSSADASRDPYVLQQLRNAELVFIAGGDQSRYVRFWKDTPVEDALNELITTKKITIGGTSAGMAILGGLYYAPVNQGVTSAEALSNPYHRNMQTIGRQDFLNVPILRRVLADTHFEQRTRNGRLVAMMARVEQDWNERAFAVACNERTAVCVDENGRAIVFSAAPQGENFAFFARSNCPTPPLTETQPETCVAGQPLTWTRGREAVKVYAIAGDARGTNAFNLATWRPVEGNVGCRWEDWYVEDGQFSRRNGSEPCLASVNVQIGDYSRLHNALYNTFYNNALASLTIVPNPVVAGAVAMLHLSCPLPALVSVSVHSLLGGKSLSVFEGMMPLGVHCLNVAKSLDVLPSGMYVCVVHQQHSPPLQNSTHHHAATLVQRYLFSVVR